MSIRAGHILLTFPGLVSALMAAVFLFGMASRRPGRAGKLPSPRKCCCEPTVSGFRNAYQVDVVITTFAPGADPDEQAYRILSKGNNQTLVQTTAPATDRDQILLMRDRDLWAFLPNLSQPIRLPLSQRLTSQVANGDLARANLPVTMRQKSCAKEKIDGDTYKFCNWTRSTIG